VESTGGGSREERRGIVSVDPDPDDVVRVYGSHGCPMAWRHRIALLYKAAAPLHFTPSEAAPLGRPVLRLSAADALPRHVDARFEGKPAVAPPPRRPALAPRSPPRRRSPRWCTCSSLSCISRRRWCYSRADAPPVAACCDLEE
jgi:hypothetical protein